MKVSNVVCFEVIEKREVYKSVLSTLHVEKLFLMLFPFILFCVAFLGNYIPTLGYATVLVFNVLVSVLFLLVTKKSLFN
jgi:hypothetical protein